MIVRLLYIWQSAAQLLCLKLLLCVTQVEPVQWSADHTRVVLSSAITSPTPLCTPPMIEAARLAVQEGYEGTMHRYI